jgi:acyl-CoA synthetase (AMP-forming)/AMP-acid ligase II
LISSSEKKISPLVAALSPLVGSAHRRGRGEKSRQRACGRAAIGCEVRIVDLDHKPVRPGEVAVRGQNVMMGYWERSEETAKAVIAGEDGMNRAFTPASRGSIRVRWPRPTGRIATPRTPPR